MMIIYCLLGVIIVLQLINIFKKKDHQLSKLLVKIDLLPELFREKINNLLLDFDNKIQIKFSQFNLETTDRLNSFSTQLKNELNSDVNKLNDTIRQELDKLNLKVEDRLKEGFDKSNQTFNNVLVRLTKIDEAQKKIDSLSTEIVSLQDILTDKKSRGIFGEVQLNQILISAFGEANSSIYQTQYKLSNGTLADAILFTPHPLGNIVIDAKFPLENYKRAIDINISAEERKKAEYNFEANVKKHINDIADKYIIEQETSTQAIMFIPAEAIFAYINAYCPKLVEYAYTKKVSITSPTTLMALLSVVQITLKNIEQTKHAEIIRENLAMLSEEFKRYRIRWDNLSNHIEKVYKDIGEINTTTNKISNRFNSIKNVDIPSLEK